MRDELELVPVTLGPQARVLPCGVACPDSHRQLPVLTIPAVNLLRCFLGSCLSTTSLAPNSTENTGSPDSQGLPRSSRSQL